MDGGGHLVPLSYVYGYRGGVGRSEVGQDTNGIRVRSSRPATNAHLLETQGPRDEILPTKNVASRADFDAASSTEVPAAWGSQLSSL